MFISVNNDHIYIYIYPLKVSGETGLHIASVAYNTIFLGEFMQPDWDMFHVS